MSGERKFRIAFLTVEAREAFREYDKPEPYFGTAPQALLQGFALLPEVEVHVVCCVQKFLRAPEKLAPNIWYHALLVPKIGWLRTSYQGCVRATRRKVLSLQPDIVHGQGTERDCALAATFTGLPNVLTIHGNMRLIARVNRARPFSFDWLSARLEEFTLPRSDGVVCITRYTEQAVADLARHTWVVPNAVDASFFEIVRRPSAIKTVLCVGHITVRKNQNRFIEALDGLAAREKFDVLFLGAASEQDDYARKFFELIKPRPWCRYGGMAGREQLKEHLSKAAALVLPSLEDNCPMVVLESMAAGVPVAAARVGGVPELIEENQTGIMFDPLNATAMAKAVEELLRETNRSTQRAAAAQQVARNRFHPIQIARRHLEIYREVLATREKAVAFEG